ncbi:hypothetical protein BpHYR1_033329 [Brachionus plicatilis]|uniref:Uncharacterized protein n=1 Tax=Brachionus plicatilis TaxID=10195 RepID=A0A3M7S2M4_BRAPC|nr:hypothetical protein BpHYR1_033329 [Brachionus plicatilis]
MLDMRIFYKINLFIKPFFLFIFHILLTRNIHYLDITYLSSIDNILSAPTEIRIPEIPGLTEERLTILP